jgi:hypothetical protein
MLANLTLWAEVYARQLYRRWHARDWRCRCGKRVFGDAEGCWWHDSVRQQVLDGEISREEDAR